MKFKSAPFAASFVSAVATFAALVTPTSAHAAPACSDLTSTNAIFQCYVAEYSVADQELNATWRDLSVLRKAPEGGTDAQKKAISNAQGAWIRLRDLDCAAEGKAMEGGTFEKVIVQSCLVSKTRERTKYLRETYQGR